MSRHSTTSIVLTTLLVVAFGWGVAFLVTRGIEAMKSGTIAVETEQRALTQSADVVNPRIAPAPPTSESITILIGGDVMFDRGIRALGEKNGYDTLIDDALVSLFKRADIVAVNLEGPITSYPSKTWVGGAVATNTLMFTFSSQVRHVLKESGITIVSLANNHTDNFGFLGTMETQDWLQDVGIAWFGNPWNSTSTKMSRVNSVDQSPVATIMTKNGLRIAFVGYHAFQSGFDRVVTETKRVADQDTFTIVMPHWGPEYVATSTPRMEAQARSFIAAGADAVIGAHPHVVMNQEWVGGVPIFYSLGNLLFDQYFSPEVMKGHIVELHIVRDDQGMRLTDTKVHEVKLVRGKGVELVE